jgi:RNA polymerase sigma factor (sigma-70 family)
MPAQPRTRAGVDQAEALSRVLAQSARLLRSHARRHAASHEDAEDALQTAYLRFIERYRGDCDPLAWLYTTIKREAWALRRKASRRRETSLDRPGVSLDDDEPWVDALPSDTPTPDERTVRNEELALRGTLIAGLKPDERRALGLLGIGLSYAEICQATGWTYTKVNRCVAEGRADLRRRFQSGSEKRGEI